MSKKRTKPLHERWKDYTQEEIYEIQRSRCCKCPYKGRISYSNAKSGMCCDYMLITGKYRPERPELCEHYKDQVEIERNSFFNPEGAGFGRRTVHE